jgi:hypothetical protein
MVQKPYTRARRRITQPDRGLRACRASGRFSKRQADVATHVISAGTTALTAIGIHQALNPARE